MSWKSIKIEKFIKEGDKIIFEAKFNIPNNEMQSDSGWIIFLYNCLLLLTFLKICVSLFVDIWVICATFLFATPCMS